MMKAHVQLVIRRKRGVLVKKTEKGVGYFSSPLNEILVGGDSRHKGASFDLLFSSIDPELNIFEGILSPRPVLSRSQKFVELLASLAITLDGKVLLVNKFLDEIRAANPRFVGHWSSHLIVYNGHTGIDNMDHGDHKGWGLNRVVDEMLDECQRHDGSGPEEPPLKNHNFIGVHAEAAGGKMEKDDLLTADVIKDQLNIAIESDTEQKWRNRKSAQ
ncbi:hypothetical protein DFH08DRAFT_817526 [Mycena albidolilacea]|uniref:Uncharacterized protein n=1 Tax=Mycena albidolilacea TaxID=1033008 RepID=A0AAD6ZHR9_9AGAR|nr:hypothetical protein DFH08DRAFT_817526 [Mycena albidolilacea]